MPEVQVFSQPTFCFPLDDYETVMAKDEEEEEAFLNAAMAMLMSFFLAKDRG